MVAIVCMDFHSHASFSRLPGRFKELGAKVYGVALEGDLILKTSALEGRLQLPATGNLPSFATLANCLHKINTQWKPDYILSGDETLLRNLLEIRKRLQSPLAPDSPKEQGVVKLLNKSLMDSDCYTRIGQMAHLEKSGFPIPEYYSIKTFEEVPKFYKKLGGTAYFKLSFEGSGIGLAKLQSEKDIETAFDKIKAFGGGPSKDAPSILQAEVTGKEYVVSFAALNGKLLGYAAIDVIEKTYENGPSSVVKAVYRPDWEKPLKKLVKSMNYTGFGGLDVIENDPDTLPTVLEINSRPTHTLPYSRYMGIDLIARFNDAVSGKMKKVLAQKTTAITDNICAIFPQELYRNLNSPYVKEGIFDVPWDDPFLMAGLLNQAGNIAPFYRMAYEKILDEHKK